MREFTRVLLCRKFMLKRGSEKKMKKERLVKFILTILIFILIGYYGVCKLYPCTSSPVIAKPVYKWGFCSMSLIARMKIVGVHELYFGFEAGKWIALLLNLVIAYLISHLIIRLSLRKKPLKEKRKKRK